MAHLAGDVGTHDFTKGELRPEANINEDGVLAHVLFAVRHTG